MVDIPNDTTNIIDNISSTDSGRAELTNEYLMNFGNQHYPAQVTMDSFRDATFNGNAFKSSYVDETGIVAGVSYYYIIKNNSTTKSLFLRPLDFGSCSLTSGSVGTQKNTLSYRVIKNGIFTVDGTTQNLQTLIDNYINLDMPKFNLKSSSTNTSQVQLIPISVGLALTSKVLVWADTATDKVLKTVAQDAIIPSTFKDVARIVAPQEILVLQFNNFDTTSAAKVAYKFEAIWSEIIL